jgi:hypothetical protein
MFPIILITSISLVNKDTTEIIFLSPSQNKSDYFSVTAFKKP